MKEVNASKSLSNTGIIIFKILGFASAETQNTSTAGNSASFQKTGHKRSLAHYTMGFSSAQSR